MQEYLRRGCGHLGVTNNQPIIGYVNNVSQHGLVVGSIDFEKMVNLYLFTHNLECILKIEIVGRYFAHRCMYLVGRRCPLGLF